MSTSVKRFFGDCEHEFKLTPRVILELERLSGQGIGALCRKLFAGDFALVDVRETIRLGLIGAGGAPEQAAALVSTYCDGAPLASVYPLAVDILSAAWFGVDAKQDGAPQ